MTIASPQLAFQSSSCCNDSTMEEVRSMNRGYNPYKRQVVKRALHVVLVTIMLTCLVLIGACTPQQTKTPAITTNVTAPPTTVAITTTITPTSSVTVPTLTTAVPDYKTYIGINGWPFNLEYPATWQFDYSDSCFQGLIGQSSANITIRFWNSTTYDVLTAILSQDTSGFTSLILTDGLDPSILLTASFGKANVVPSLVQSSNNTINQATNTHNTYYSIFPHKITNKILLTAPDTGIDLTAYTCSLHNSALLLASEISSNSTQADKNMLQDVVIHMISSIHPNP